MLAARDYAVITVLGDAMLWLTSTPREFALSRTPASIHRLMEQFFARRKKCVGSVEE